MKIIQKLLSTLILGILILSFYSFDVPKGWFKEGDNQDCFEVTFDKGAGMEGGTIASIKSICNKKMVKGYLVQTCEATKYKGKRIRMSAYMKTKDLKYWSGMWLRISGLDDKEVLGYDDMHDRALKGTTEWTKCEIVLDVPTKANRLNFGFMMSGRGQVWLDRLKFEEVDKSVALTTKDIRYPLEPSNLNFNN